MTHVSDLFDPSVWRDVPGFDALTGRGRAAGVAGIALSLVANPWILTRLLDAIGPLLTSAS